MGLVSDPDIERDGSDVSCSGGDLGFGAVRDAGDAIGSWRFITGLLFEKSLLVRLTLPSSFSLSLMHYIHDW